MGTMTLYKGNRRVKRFKANGRNVRFLMKEGRQVWPCRKALSMGSLEYRITNDGGEKWFEVAWQSLEVLTGSAAAGWQDARGYIKLDLEQSENLTQWNRAKFVDALGSPETVGDGSFKYWARCIHPVDSTIKTGRMRAAGPSTGDPRNGPFTALTVGGVIQTLPHFPYTMPTDAALLQADLRAAGWVGATVTATNFYDWEIIIPDVYYNGASIVTKVFWPVYYVADIFGALDSPVDGVSFSGEFVNEAGIRTALPKQFARIAATRGPRVLP
jgi:hypothetical protein